MRPTLRIRPCMARRGRDQLTHAHLLVSFTARAESIKIREKQHIGANFGCFYSVVTVSRVKWTCKEGLALS